MIYVIVQYYLSDDPEYDDEYLGLVKAGFSQDKLELEAALWTSLEKDPRYVFRVESVEFSGELTLT